MASHAFLLRSQRNDVFKALRDNKLAPSEFRWEERLPEYALTGIPLGNISISVLVHRPTGYEFAFNMSTAPFEATFFPGHRREPRQFERAENWIKMLNWVHLWLQALKRECDTPDYWAEIGEGADIASAVQAAPNEPFSSEEQGRIAAALEELRTYLLGVVAELGRNEEDRQHVIEQVDYLVESSK